MIPILGSIELGTWLGWLLAKFGCHERTSARLIEGTRAVRSIPMLDRQMERQARGASKMERELAARVAAAARFFTNTRAFELAIVKMVYEWRRRSVNRPATVRLHL